MKKTPCFASFSYWGVHWLKLAPELKKVPGGKTTTHNILFEPILPNFEEIFEIGHDDFGGCPTLPVRKTAKSEKKYVTIRVLQLHPYNWYISLPGGSFNS